MTSGIHAMNEPADFLAASLAEALFASDISASTDPTFTEVGAAIRQAVRAHGGTQGCAGKVAAAFGDYPEVAGPRMRWAQQVVRSTYPHQAVRPGQVAAGQKVAAVVSQGDRR